MSDACAAFDLDLGVPGAETSSEATTTGGFLVISGAKTSWLNGRFWAVLAKSALCLLSVGRSSFPHLRLALDTATTEKFGGSYRYCIEVIDNESCKEACFVAVAKLPLQRLIATRTFGNVLISSDLPSFISADLLGWHHDHHLLPCKHPTVSLLLNGTQRQSVGKIQRVAVPAVQLNSRDPMTPPNKVLGMFHDTGFDFNGAVLYKHEVEMWPPLFLRYYETGEWCVELGWCYVHRCFPADPVASASQRRTCAFSWQGCRQGIEVMCLKNTWKIRDWIGKDRELREHTERILAGCCPDALLTLPGIHQEHVGLLRHRLILGNYTGLNAQQLWSSEMPGVSTTKTSSPSRAGKSKLRWRHVIVVRVPKASSSTLASVFVRLGRSLGHLIPVGEHPERFRPRRYKSQRVQTRVMLTTRHETPRQAWTSWMETMNWPKPVVVASLRHPYERCVSRIYHAYIDQKHGPRMEEKMTLLRSKCYEHNFSWEQVCCGDFQCHFLALPGESTEDLLARYDFIFITERFADSLLVFRSMWNLTFAQLLHVRVKSAETRQVCSFQHREGYTVRPDPGEKEMLATVRTEPGFLENNQRDLFLWNRANARLDELLEAYGMERLTHDREMLDAVLTIARDSCQRVSMEACIDCLHEDIGCAQDCLDRVSEVTRVFVGNT